MLNASVMQRLKKALLISVASILIFGLLVILFISPITKYLVEKYDVKYTGRQIQVNGCYVNPFTGYIQFSNLKIYEFKSDTIFFSTNTLSANFAMLEFLSKTIEITEITLDHPVGIIIKNKSKVNFNDLIEKFSTKNKNKKSSAIHFNILNIKVNDGVVCYQETDTPVNYFIKEVNIESEGKMWDVDSMSAKISLLSGIGTGDLSGNITTNFNSLDYHFNAVAHKFDLKIIEQYLAVLINYGSFKANIDVDVKATGNFNSKENIDAKGLLVINDFHFGKTIQEDYSSFDKFTLFINELNPQKHIYLIDSASLQHPYFKYERYDYNLDNVQTMFGKKGANVIAVNSNPEKFNLIIEIAKYVKILAKNFFKSDYKVNRMAIYDGDFKYNDYTLNEKFSADASHMYAFADSINKNNQWVTASFRSDIKPFGNAMIKVGINPKDSSDFDIKYNLQKMPLSMFNPYMISYTSFPLDRGSIELNGKWKVRNGIIQSENHLVIIDPRLTRRLRNQNIKWLPMRIIMGLIRERGNVIDYEIPIAGSLKNPKFYWKDVLLDLLGNIFVKPATTPYRIEVKNLETEIEKSLTLKWELRQNTITSSQEEFIDKMAEFLKKNPEASIVVSPQQYSIKEKEYILFFEAKKKYYLLVNNKNSKYFTEEDSLSVDQMSVKDSLFIRFLNKRVNCSEVFTVQEKCATLINPVILGTKFNQLNKERINAFVSYFKNKGVENQIKIYAGKNVIPYNGFSFFEIKYNGEFPKSLTKAYQQMNDFDGEAPRKKFKRERRKIQINTHYAVKG